MISKGNRDRLENAGIRIFDKTNSLTFVKKNGINGNFIPNYKTMRIQVMDKMLNVVEEVHSDCPHVSLFFENKIYYVMVWDWVPGPGPGDFNVSFNSEQEAFNKIWEYFFYENEHFQKRLEYHLNKNK